MHLIKTGKINTISIVKGYPKHGQYYLLGAIFAMSPTSEIWPSFLSPKLAIFLLLVLFINLLPAKSKPCLPQVRTIFPFAIDYIVRGIIYNTGNQSLRFWEELFTKYSPSQTLEVRIGPQTVILSHDPEVVKALLTSQFAEYGKGVRFHAEWRPFLGDAIFTTDGDKWHASRALIRPIFTRDRVSDLSTFERHMQRLLGVLGDNQKLESKKPVDVFDLYLRLTMDIATDFLLGESVGSLENPADKFSVAFADVQRVQSWITMAG